MIDGDKILAEMQLSPTPWRILSIEFNGVDLMHGLISTPAQAVEYLLGRLKAKSTIAMFRDIESIPVIAVAFDHISYYIVYLIEVDVKRKIKLNVLTYPGSFNPIRLEAVFPDLAEEMRRRYGRNRRISLRLNSVS